VLNHPLNHDFESNLSIYHLSFSNPLVAALSRVTGSNDCKIAYEILDGGRDMFVTDRIGYIAVFLSQTHNGLPRQPE